MFEVRPRPVLDEFGQRPTEPPPTPFETVDALTAFVPVLRDDDGLLDVAVAAYRHLGFAQAALLRALAELHSRFEAESPPTPLGREPLLDVAGEFSPAAAVAPGTANTLVDLAIRLVRTLPRTLDALARGETDLAKAKVVADVTAALDASGRRRVEDVALAEAPTKTPRQLRRLLEAEAIAADPAAAENRHKAARERRRVESYPEPDGMATLVFHGPAEKCAQIYDVIDHAARCGYAPGDERTLDQRRFDAVHDLVTGALESPRGERPSAAGELQVVISASTLMALNDRPALLKGYGPITAAAAREFAKDARWRRLVTDDMDGSLLDVGTRSYRPPKHLERFVKIRDLTCIAPSCDRDARTSQIDHTENFPDGPTVEGNLGTACPTDHNRKTRGSVSVEQIEPGVFLWTTRLGRTYEVDRRPYLPFTDNELTGHDQPPPF